MKIIAWNCNMAFRKKAHLILAHKPDIVVIPECEHPDKLIFPNDIPKPQDVLWFGKNPHKGLGIFSYSNFRFKVHETYNPDFQLIIPIIVSDGIFEFILLAIWANNPTDKDGRYIEQIWKAINYYATLLESKTSILIGDFNSNTIWDKQHKYRSHSNVVEILANKKIVSAYHLHHKQIQGIEEHPTLYMYRHESKPYHIDYCFVSADLAERITSVDIGEYKSWFPYSDHVPLFVIFD